MRTCYENFEKSLEGGNFVEKVGKCRLSKLMLNFLMVRKKIQIWSNSGSKFHYSSQNSLTFCQFIMFHDLSMTIFIFQDFQSLRELCRLTNSNMFEMRNMEKVFLLMLSFFFKSDQSKSVKKRSPTLAATARDIPFVPAV